MSLSLSFFLCFYLFLFSSSASGLLNPSGAECKAWGHAERNSIQGSGGENNKNQLKLKLFEKHKAQEEGIMVVLQFCILYIIRYHGV